MYARVTIIQFQPGKIDEANHIVKDSVIPVMKDQQAAYQVRNDK